MEVNWLVKIYHKFFIYLPVVLILFLTSTIYISYYHLYIVPLYNSYQSSDLFLSEAVAKKSNETKATVFLCVVSISGALMFMNMLRVIFMDPGFFPSPTELEIDLISNKNVTILLGILENFDTASEGPEIGTDLLPQLNKLISNGPIDHNESENLKCQIHRIVGNEGECEHFDEEQNLLRKYIPSRDNKPLLCSTCLRVKIERSHHCKQCQKCVLRMDHHCPWLANCIGLRNFKYFCLLHLYGFVASLTIACTMWEPIFKFDLAKNESIVMCGYLAFVYFTNLGLFAFLSWLLYVNTGLLLYNETIIEKADREKFPTSKSKNVYDLGMWENFKTIFGGNPLLWLLPIGANYKYNGLAFDKVETKNC